MVFFAEATTAGDAYWLDHKEQTNFVRGCCHQNFRL